MNKIFRPYKNINHTVRCLSDQHLYRYGVLYTHKLIMQISNEIGIVENELYDFTTDNEELIFFYNDGKPYLPFLIKYHELSMKEWIKRGGYPTDFISDISELIENMPRNRFRKTPPCTEKSCKNDIKQLLYMDYFWYKRFFVKNKNVERFK